MKTRGRPFSFWTMERRRDLVDLKAKKWSHDQCARHFGCKKASVENVWHRIRKERGDAPLISSGGNRNRADSTSRMTAAVVHAKAARESLPLPDSITAYLCGDPLPGRSALDRKRLGIVDKPEPHWGVRTNRITLPTEPLRCP